MPNNEINIDANEELQHCNKCKKASRLEMFSDNVGNTFATCYDCRVRDNSRRHPPVFSRANNQILDLNTGKSLHINKVVA